MATCMEVCNLQHDLPAQLRDYLPGDTALGVVGCSTHGDTAISQWGWCTRRGVVHRHALCSSSASSTGVAGVGIGGGTRQVPHGQVQRRKSVVAGVKAEAVFGLERDTSDGGKSRNGVSPVKHAVDGQLVEVDAVTEAEWKENGFRSTRRTKLICAVGPATCAPEQLEAPTTTCSCSELVA